MDKLLSNSSWSVVIPEASAWSTSSPRASHDDSMNAKKATIEEAQKQSDTSSMRNTPKAHATIAQEDAQEARGMQTDVSERLSALTITSCAHIQVAETDLNIMQEDGTRGGEQMDYEAQTGALRGPHTESAATSQSLFPRKSLEEMIAYRKTMKAQQRSADGPADIRAHDARSSLCPPSTLGDLPRFSQTGPNERYAQSRHDIQEVRNKVRAEKLLKGWRVEMRNPKIKGVTVLDARNA
ncbi:hypothetical protein BDV96DRAFT_593017 [Lophiotrema nucula]|uniref:Uncharacterized protein n=1 Tax=Lophiotrema nucula TaxID=690887 RepID=A0A6A5ZRY7_9PLEO|nr:hypothetical protein BDV96DRAFT_593017 [Lophiotrema nucula]